MANAAVAAASAKPAYGCAGWRRKPDSENAGMRTA
jgi:hypothetical protein